MHQERHMANLVEKRGELFQVFLMRHCSNSPGSDNSVPDHSNSQVLLVSSDCPGQCAKNVASSVYIPGTSWYSEARISGSSGLRYPPCKPPPDAFHASSFGGFNIHIRDEDTLHVSTYIYSATFAHGPAAVSG